MTNNVCIAFMYETWKFHTWFIDIPSQTLKFTVNQKEKKKLLILWQ